MHAGDDVDWLQMKRTMPTTRRRPSDKPMAPVIDRLWHLALTRKGTRHGRRL